VGYRVRAEFYGYVTAVDEVDGEKILYVTMTDVARKEDYHAELPVKNIFPTSEREYALHGAYFRLTVRRRVTIKFFKHYWTRRKLNRAHRSFARHYPELKKKMDSIRKAFHEDRFGKN